MPELFRRIKADIQLMQLPVPLYENSLCAVDHYLRDFGIFNKLLQNSKLPDRMKYFLSKLLSGCHLKAAFFALLLYLFINPLPDLLLAHLTGKVNSLHNRFLQLKVLHFIHLIPP